MTELNLSDKEVRKLLAIPEAEFPKYTSQLINLANQNAQGTRPKVVGQMSELIREFPGREYQEWIDWYTSNFPEKIDNAKDKIKSMISNLREAIDKIDDDLIEHWVKDLVLAKTFSGLKFQKAIMKKVAKHFNKPYRFSVKEEESRGIDGYIADIPISIKPDTYDIKRNLAESLPKNIVFYAKKKNKITITFDFTL